MKIEFILRNKVDIYRVHSTKIIRLIIMALCKKIIRVTIEPKLIYNFYTERIK